LANGKNNTTVLIAGGGIGGMSLALTLHQIGVDCLVLESVSDLKPLGVGVNVQPNAVRELYDLGFDETQLNGVGVQAKEWALVGRNGKEIYTEPRGQLAGYSWPQYAVHRGRLQMLLYEAVLSRLGASSIKLGHRVTGYRNHSDGGGVTALVETTGGGRLEIDGALLIGVDGIHSVVREQMYPEQPPINWGGAIMWRGTSQGVPIRTGASFIGLGSHTHRMVFYPISQPEASTGLSTINWIAEITVDSSAGWTKGDWTRRVDIDEFIGYFDDWKYDWLDAAAMLRGADEIFEYPMIDRDPIPSWVDGRVALLGDAAHVMYPTGSNGASQAIVDGRVLGAAMIEHGVTPEALQTYDERLCAGISALVLRNRGAGPFGILNIVDERCGGIFENINDVIPPEELDEFMSRYKAAAGLAIEQLNAAKPTIAPGARVAGR
jgi:5-methylphenazine-1-carboxylate 1-monooxygenase